MLINGIIREFNADEVASNSYELPSSIFSNFWVLNFTKPQKIKMNLSLWNYQYGSLICLCSHFSECISSDGHRVLEGEAVTLACSTCACVWGEMHCSPRPCPTPAGCHRSPVSAPLSASASASATSTDDECCGELICDPGTISL